MCSHTNQSGVGNSCCSDLFKSSGYFMQLFRVIGIIESRPLCEHCLAQRISHSDVLHSIFPIYCDNTKRHFSGTLNSQSNNLSLSPVCCQYRTNDAELLMCKHRKSQRLRYPDCADLSKKKRMGKTTFFDTQRYYIRIVRMINPNHFYYKLNENSK